MTFQSSIFKIVIANPGLFHTQNNVCENLHGETKHSPKDKMVLVFFF